MTRVLFFFVAALAAQVAVAQEPSPPDPLLPCSCSYITNAWGLPGRIMDVPGRTVVYENGIVTGEVMGRDRAVWVLLGSKMAECIKQHVAIRAAGAPPATADQFRAENACMRGVWAEIEAARK
jgi:hypothetical protein